MSGKEYEQRLRSQFESVYGKSSWAQDALQEAQALAGGQVLKSTKKLISSRRGVLTKGSLDFSRVRDANHHELSQAVVQSINFHPSAPICITAGFDKTLRLFQV